MDPDKLAALQASLNRALIKPQDPNEPTGFDKIKAMFGASPSPVPSQTPAPSPSPDPGSNLEALQYGVNQAFQNPVNPMVAARMRALQKLQQ